MPNGYARRCPSSPTPTWLPSTDSGSWMQSPGVLVWWAAE
jgi:hypothetical protein